MALTIDELNILIEAESTKATDALDKLIDKLKTVESKLNGLRDAGKKTGKGLQDTAKGATKVNAAIDKQGKKYDKATKSSQKFTDALARKISKFHTLYGAFKSAAQMMGGWFNESNDYIETLNLFNVTMGEGADAAYEYAASVQKLIGIDIAEWMKYQGTFKQLTSGFGVASKEANIMSQNLTQLSYDLASFFNTDVETAFDKLSSAMSGQVKGLREFGIDTTVASLQEYALAKGIDTSVRSMTQAEKSLLRYNYIMEKSIIMQGDMARTLVTPANSLRILKAQLTQLKRAFGDIISVLAVKVIPYVQAFVSIITDAAKSIANFFGFKLPTIDYSGLDTGGFAEDLESAEDSTNGTADSLKAIKKQLMGFDEINIISNPDTDSSGSDGGGGVGGGLNGMEPLGYDFLKGLDTSKVDEIKEKMKDILEYVVLIGAAFLGWKLGSFLKDIALADTALKGFKKWAAGAGIALGATVAITGLTWLIDTSIDVWKNGLGIPEFGELMAASGFTIAGAALLGGSLAVAFGKTFGSGIKIGAQISLGASGLILLINGIKDIIDNGPTWANVLTIVAGAVMVLTAAIWAGIPAKIADKLETLAIIALYAKDFLVSVYQSTVALVKQIVQWGIVTGAKILDTAATWAVIAAQTAWNVICVVATTVTTALGAAFNFLCSPIGLVVLAIGAIIAIVILCIEYWEEIKATAIAVWEGIKSVFSTIANWMYDYVVKPVADFFSGLWDGFVNGAKAAWEGVKSVFSAVVNFFKTIFTNAWKAIVNVFSVAGEVFVAIKDGIVSAFKFVVNGIIKGLNAVVALPFKGLNKILDTIHGISIVGVEPFSWLTWRAPVPQIPLLANGGIVDEGQMFIAREAGPELVGSIGRKTAVANNDQIVSGIESGVYRAMVAANANKNSGGTQTFRIINEIDGDIVGEKVIKYHNGVVMQTGASPLLV